MLLAVPRKPTSLPPFAALRASGRGNSDRAGLLAVRFSSDLSEVTVRPVSPVQRILHIGVLQDTSRWQRNVLHIGSGRANF